MAPDLSLEDVQGNPVAPSGFGGVVSGARSKDNKTLMCYYTWKFPQDSIGRDVVLNVQALHRDVYKRQGFDYETETD